MRKLALLLFCLLCADAQAQQAVVVPATTAQVSITGAVTGSLRLITGIAGRQIYVTHVNLIPVATSVVTFFYGTGTNCNTGTTNVTGAMTFAAGQVLAAGDGYGAVWVIPPGNDLCIVIATAAAPGSLAYALF